MSKFQETTVRPAILLFLTIACLGVVEHAAGQTLVLRVNGDDGALAPPAGPADGTDWGAPFAFRFLQDALKEAALQAPGVTKVEIWVASTVATNPYLADQDSISGGTGDEFLSFDLVDKVQVYGGFVGTELSLPERNPETNVTVLDGDLMTNYTPPCGDAGSGACSDPNGIPGCNDEDCCRTVCQADPDCCLMGWDQGCVDLADIVCGTCPSIGNCFLEHANPGCEDEACCAQVCDIFPLCCLGPWTEDCADVAADNCILSGESLESNHVVTAVDVDTTARLDGFTIRNGLADGGFLTNDNSGAGIQIDQASPVIVRCTLDNNQAPNGKGGGIHVLPTSDPVVIDCTLMSNKATTGGAMLIESGSEATLVNCVLMGNVAVGGSPVATGGAIRYAGGPGRNLEIINCTFTSNLAFPFTAGLGGALSIADGSQATITNSILWADTALDGPSKEIHLEGAGSSALVNYSDVEGGGFAGIGNIDEDPLFISLQDARISVPCSPVVDSGNNPAVPDDLFDVDNDGFTTGQPTPDRDVLGRILDGLVGGNIFVDMGAYEFGNQFDPAGCVYACGDSGDIGVGIVDFLELLNQWGMTGTSCDFYCNGVGINEFLDLLAHWGPNCGTPLEGPPQSVQDCINRFGTEDPLVLQHCICKIDPCEQGCPPDPSCN